MLSLLFAIADSTEFVGLATQWCTFWAVFEEAPESFIQCFNFVEFLRKRKCLFGIRSAIKNILSLILFRI